jgi:ribosomal protein L12E/L44/L45/RPP1/RPP2
MTTQFDEDFSDDDDLEQPEPQVDIKSLRKAASRSKKLEAELNSLRREMAFAKAGLPLDDPKMNYFVKGYEGEMSAEAIRQAALEAGFLASQSSQEKAPDPALQAAAAAQTRVMQASAGAAVEGESEASALAHLEQAMAEGGIEAMIQVAQQYGIPTAYDS